MLKQQSHIVAPIPDELRTRALYTVNELRERGKADKEVIDKLYSLIIDLTDNDLDFFFLEPLRRLKAGNMLMQPGLDSGFHRGNHPRTRGTRAVTPVSNS